uniref:Uncharacterized protein n=1 Tax=Anguilla anguilla TaxID=7936 RepID=A0A0E9XF54_ANGAN
MKMFVYTLNPLVFVYSAVCFHTYVHYILKTQINHHYSTAHYLLSNHLLHWKCVWGHKRESEPNTGEIEHL